MRAFQRMILLSCPVFLVIGLCTSVRAQAFRPAPPMRWDDFHALYEEAGRTGGEVTLTGNLQLKDSGSYVLDETEQSVTIVTPPRCGISVWSDAVLTIQNPKLTIKAEDNLDGALIVSGGTLRLVACGIETRNGSALKQMSADGGIDMEAAEAVRIQTTYTVPASDERSIRVGIYGGYSNTPLVLRNLDLTVEGGDAAIYLDRDLELESCEIIARGPDSAAAVKFWEGSTCSITRNHNTVLLPPVSGTDPDPGTDPEPPIQPSYQASLVLPGTGTEAERKGWCMENTAASDISLPKTAIVYYEGTTEAGEVEGYIEDVPLHWDTAKLPNPLAAGVYTLSGTPDPAALLVEGWPVKNPGALTADFELTVYPAGPPTIRVESGPLPEGGRLALYRDMPPFAMAGTTAVFAEYSADEKNWKRAAVNTRHPADEPVYSENLLAAFGFDPEERELTVRIPLDGFYTRLVIVGGPFAGTTNIVEHGVVTPPREPDDDSGGDRGGGGQGEHDRPGKEPASQPPAASAVSVPKAETSISAAPPADPESATANSTPELSRSDGASPSSMEETQTSSGEISSEPPAQPALNPAPAKEPPPDRLPGFAAAAIATAVAVLGGAAWYFFRSKKN